MEFSIFLHIIDIKTDQNLKENRNHFKKSISILIDILY
jgi:hypothetical protein